MKIIVAVVLVVVLFVLVHLHSLARAERRAKFVNTMAVLKQSQYEPQKLTSITIYYHGFSIYPYTNRFVIAGTNYQCEFAAESEEFNKWGFLTFTTNQVFVWVDKRHGLIPLDDSPATFPPEL
jgi:hypothetical protein